MVRAIGLMSGTSMDGVDVALIETDGEEAITLGPARSYPYAEADRALLRGAVTEAASLDDRRARPGSLAEADAMITDRHAEAVEDFLVRESLDRAAIDLIGFHGQTVLHRPERRLTVQIGDGTDLAAKLGIKVAFDFRAADVAQGGQGAPLVPVFHRALAAAAGFLEPVAVINIGGVANISFIAPGREPIACDTGPGNALLDDLMQNRLGLAFDQDGAAAAQGRVDQRALDELLAHPFFAAPPPKSLDQPKLSAKTILHGSLSANSRIKVLLRAPPPHTIAMEGMDGKSGSTRAMLAAVKAISVAAASSVASLSTVPLEKSFRSSDFGGGAAKKGCASSSSKAI